MYMHSQALSSWIFSLVEINFCSSFIDMDFIFIRAEVIIHTNRLLGYQSTHIVDANIVKPD